METNRHRRRRTAPSARDHRACASARATWVAASVATGLAVWLAPAAAHADSNLLGNGSFETGLSSWRLSGTETQGYPETIITYNSSAGYPNGAYGEAVTAPTGSASPDTAGSKGLYFVSDLARETVSQSVTLTAGTYDVGLSLYAPQNGWNNVGDATIDASVGNETLISTDVHALKPKSWYNISSTFQATTTGTYTMSFSFATAHVPSADVVIDQVYIKADSSGKATASVSPGEAPLPLLGASPVAVLALGGGLLATRRRKADA